MENTADGKLTFDTSLNTAGFKKGLLKVSDSFGASSVFSSVTKGFQNIGQSVQGAADKYQTLNRFPSTLQQLSLSTSAVGRSTKVLSGGVKELNPGLKRLSLSAAGADKATKNLTGSVQTLNPVMSGFTEKSNRAMGILGQLTVFSLVAKSFQLIGQSIGAATNRYDTLTRFPTVLEKMGFSAADAERSTKKLSDGITGLPTALDEVVGTAQRMASMTGNLEEATDVTLALNNAFLASGSTADMAKRGTEQYLQALGRGKFEMEDWKTLQETMSYGLVKIAEKFGFAGQSAQKDLYEALKSGKISMKDFNKALLECNEGIGGFAEVAKDSTKGIGTAMQNMRTSVVRGLANMIKTVNEGLSKTKYFRY